MMSEKEFKLMGESWCQFIVEVEADFPHIASKEPLLDYTEKLDIPTCRSTEFEWKLIYRVHIS